MGYVFESDRMSVQTLKWGAREQNRVYRCVYWKHIYYIWYFENRKCYWFSFWLFLAGNFQKKGVCFTYCSICSEMDAVIETDKTQLISLFWREISHWLSDECNTLFIPNLHWCSLTKLQSWINNLLQREMGNLWSLNFKIYGFWSLCCK